MTGSWGFYVRVKDDRFSSYADPGIRGIRAQRNTPIPRNARAPVRARRTVFAIRARLPYFASPKLARSDDLDPLLFVRRNKTIFRVFFFNVCLETTIRFARRYGLRYHTIDWLPEEYNPRNLAEIALLI